MKKPFLIEAGLAIDANSVVYLRPCTDGASKNTIRLVGAWSWQIDNTIRERLLRELYPRMIEIGGIFLNREHVVSIGLFSPVADGGPWVVRALTTTEESHSGSCQDEATARRLFAAFHG